MDHALADRLKQALDAHDPRSLNEVAELHVKGSATFVVYAYGWPTLLTAVLKSPALFKDLEFIGPELGCDTELLHPGTRADHQVDRRRGGRLMVF